MNRFTCLLLLASLPAAAHAQTPDGATPAEETVCDPLRDATPGLYGLCVAYCEAQDCHEESASNRRSCDRVLTNFEAKRQPGDPDMPCLSVPCPCFDQQAVADFIDDHESANYVYNDDTDYLYDIDGQVIEYLGVQSGEGFYCEYNAGGVYIGEGLDLEEYDACRALVIEGAEDGGVDSCDYSTWYLNDYDCPTEGECLEVGEPCEFTEDCCSLNCDGFCYP